VRVGLIKAGSLLQSMLLKLSAKRLLKPLVSSILAKAIVTALLAVAGAWIETLGWLSRSSTSNASLAGLAAAC
jgi:hypothetical protein